jgi:hypothetical protein
MVLSPLDQGHPPPQGHRNAGRELVRRSDVNQPSARREGLDDEALVVDRDRCDSHTRNL